MRHSFMRLIAVAGIVAMPFAVQAHDPPDSEVGASNGLHEDKISRESRLVPQEIRHAALGVSGGMRHLQGAAPERNRTAVRDRRDIERAGA